MLELYQNIKARRIELGLSQTQLAELTGYADKSAISKIEKGMRDIPQSKLMAFAVALKTTPSDLVGSTEDNKQKHALYRVTDLGYHLIKKVSQPRVFL